MTSRSELAHTLDEPVRALQTLLAVGRHLGILEHSYARHGSGTGRASRYRIVVPLEDALTILGKFGWENIAPYKEDGRAPRRERVAVASPRDGGELRAVAGPERVSPFAMLRPLKYSESAAQVEAARQYRDRVSFVDEEIQRFAEKGIKVDRGAFKVERDQRLEAIMLALPYVESLEKQVENLTSRLKQSGDIVAVRRELEETKVALKRCQDRAKAETSARVLREQAESSRD